jgi:hypothetical protein
MYHNFGISPKEVIAGTTGNTDRAEFYRRKQRLCTQE